jgi:SAM-dependent methyltransferase
VTEHPVFGLSAPERGWVPALRYALRRERVLALADRLPRGRLLEVGCGAGALLHDLAERGFACEALETSEEALELARFLNQSRPEVRIHAEPQPGWAESFDVLVSLEVLEHIEDDAAALASWRGWLRPGGHLLLSVPSRPELWNASDVWVGHYRRYGREDLLRLLDRAGFAVAHAECYGYPLSNLAESIRAWLHGRRLRASGVPTAAAGTARSGIERGIETRLYPLQASRLGSGLFRACCRVQERYLDRELGTGHLVLAARR